MSDEEEADETETEETPEADEQTEETELDTTPLSEEEIEAELDEAEAELEDAETEADLDVVEAHLDEIEGHVEDADLPEPDDEDEEGPREQFEDRLADLRSDLEEQRGPYAEDVVEDVSAAGTTVEETEWTDDGREELVEVVEAFVADVEEILGVTISAPISADIEDLARAIEDAAVEIGEAGLDPDEDEATIAELQDAASDLEGGVDAAEEWDDLETREQLQAQGYYEVLDHRKDYPPEWHALKVWEKRGRADMVLLALDSFQSNFMEEHCKDALERMGHPDSLDKMKELAQRRDESAIRTIGKIGDEDGLDAVLDYVDSDPGLAKPALRAVGEIGSEEATQDVAEQLASDESSIRSQAARALGLIGDTRAIEPLADLLEDDEADEVRASAAWALNQIGTERALDAVRPYADDRAYLVQAEAEKAVESASRPAA
ncbi:HEAT repeat domain-containing protein [Halorussus gelatinilyticus]|uniref:HEAT repeat domain-containing protein n=1 Tax=Halorussus gelatinilyticus TaxID=2937524 RepID=A0A8U0IFY8_9EURY|nr:HEAT repeat domain-containing protein [Halorussus gelatinilyticus]UPV99654.1 HEAT repeat domain-containing protein [Halorussus gelatinilyticus]